MGWRTALIGWKYIKCQCLNLGNLSCAINLCVHISVYANILTEFN